MATKVRRRRLFLKENREAKGLSAAKMAEKLGIERESVYRLEREQWRMDPEKQSDYAHALGLEPEDLWRLPSDPSLDAIVARAPQDVQDSIQTLIKNLIPTQK